MPKTYTHSCVTLDKSCYDDHIDSNFTSLLACTKCSKSSFDPIFLIIFIMINHSPCACQYQIFHSSIYFGCCSQLVAGTKGLDSTTKRLALESSVVYTQFLHLRRQLLDAPWKLVNGFAFQVGTFARVNKVRSIPSLEKNIHIGLFLLNHKNKTNQQSGSFSVVRPSDQHQEQRRVSHKRSCFMGTRGKEGDSIITLYSLQENCYLGTHCLAAESGALHKY